MVTIVSNEAGSSQDSGWYCLNCAENWVIPAGVCTDCKRRMDLAKALHLAGMTAVPDPQLTRKKGRSSERLHLRLMALLQNYGYLTRWNVPDVKLFASLMGRTVSATHASLAILVRKGWLDVRKRGSQNEYRIALHPND